MAKKNTPVPETEPERERPPVIEQTPEVAALEEDLRRAAEQTAALQNENIALRKANEEYQKEVDSKWDAELKKAYAKIRKELLADGKLALSAVEGEAVLLAKDVRQAILEVRNTETSFAFQVAMDTILAKLGIK
jgi:predicted RNase H-like nuclease (RuvC/YqgF family)